MFIFLIVYLLLILCNLKFFILKTAGVLREQFLQMPKAKGKNQIFKFNTLNF